MPAPKVGQVVHNKYRLLRHIGDGGMGSVYEARHENLGTTVALKFLHLEFAKREGLVQRFLQEARASARIQSPHVVRVSDVDQSPDGEVFIVLEYLEGQTLQALYEDLYRARRKLPYGDALDYAEQMLDGVEAAHAAGIVHRDLKPDNVMVTMDAKGVTVLKLLDFGIAKLKGIGGVAFESSLSSRGSLSAPSQRGLTRPGVMMGTPEYMAPEQATSADAVDARADVFSLGVIIFELLAGQRPVGGDNPLELADAYKAGKVSKLTDLVPGIAPELAAAIHRALSPDPKDRFASAAEMRDAIAPFALAVRAPPPSRRVGGTIGVATSQPWGTPVVPRPPGSPNPSEPEGAALRALPAVPPPATFEGPSLLEQQAAGAHAGPASTIIDDGGSEGAAPDRTHRIGEPYSPIGSPMGNAPAMGTPPPSVRQAPIAIANAPASRAFADVASVGPDAKRMLPTFSRKPKPKQGLPIARVLLAAACVAGAAVGITYLASRSSTKDDDAPIAAITTGPASTSSPSSPSSPASTSGPQAQPPQAAVPGEIPAGVAPVPPQAARPRHGGGRLKAPPNPANPASPASPPTSPTSPTPSAPSADPNSPNAPAAPAPPPALVLPSSLPFPNPFDPE